MEHKHPPRVLTDAGLSLFVNTVRLRELPLPVVEIPLEKLLWHFDMPVWEKDGTDDWNLMPWEVIRKEEGTTTHWKRMEEADLGFPIIVTDYNHRLVILDGMHRLVKAYLERHATISAKVIPAGNLQRR